MTVLFHASYQDLMKVQFASETRFDEVLCCLSVLVVVRCFTFLVFAVGAVGRLDTKVVMGVHDRSLSSKLSGSVPLLVS